MWRVTSARGRELIESFEGRRNRAYRCPAGIWTCGIGCAGPDIGPDTEWTDDEVEARFSADLRKFEVGINKLVTAPITQPMFDALVSLAFNVGLHNFKNSTLLKMLNKGAYRQAADEFGRWCHAGSVVLPGLVRRRRAEAAMFLRRD
jgi:lysozyme